MPRRDGTGPTGQGAMTGRGLGYCATGRPLARNFGRGMRLGRGFGYNYGYVANDKESLKAEKEYLQNRINDIDKELNK